MNCQSILRNDSSLFPEDPRNWEAFSFVLGLLQEIARERGKSYAKLGINEIYIKGKEEGFNSLELEQAIYGLPF
jgi:hypothetical protein